MVVRTPYVVIGTNDCIRSHVNYYYASFPTFWQFADSGPNPGDQDLFNGDMAGLQRYVLADVLEITISLKDYIWNYKNR